MPLPPGWAILRLNLTSLGAAAIAERRKGTERRSRLLEHCVNSFK